MLRGHSPLLQRIELRQEQLGRTRSFNGRPTLTTEASALSRTDNFGDTSGQSSYRSSRLFLTERNSNSKSLNLRFQQDSLCQKLLESKLDCAFRCALVDAENQHSKNPPSSKKVVLTNSYLIADGLFSKGASPVRSPLKTPVPAEKDAFGCKKLDFSVPTNTPSSSRTPSALPVKQPPSPPLKALPPPPTPQPDPPKATKNVMRRSRSIWSSFPQIRRHKVAFALLQVLRKLKKCHLKTKDLDNPAYFPRQNYYLPNAIRLFRLVAANDLEKTRQLLDEEPSLVFQLDSVCSPVFPDAARHRRPPRPPAPGRPPPRTQQFRRRRGLLRQLGLLLRGGVRPRRTGLRGFSRNSSAATARST